MQRERERERERVGCKEKDKRKDVNRDTLKEKDTGQRGAFAHILKAHYFR